ncbi:hypothetical protein PRIPAC_76187 [Pristionchus pacificus]|uniref:Uncharacterized protein n=1 Tax=Pristionchus pacificus TaxID=54126 RepID=A0A2A6C5P2_PRIPA|nr:hypothetical protein PRIPAC_76187 [Pristionchus pacificus]|eukprot:PDM73532.1 hypothetical protein PRIPAC_40888 [Pristionchus pacificus]
MADRRRKDGDSPTLMVPTRTCVACEMSKPWRDMVKWTPDRELEKRWTSALTPNDNEQRILDAKLDGLRGKNQTIYVCESHFDRDRCFKLTPSGFMLRPNSVPVDVRKLLNDRSSQNAPSSSNNQDMPPPSPLSVHALTSPSPSSRGGGKRSKDMDEMEMMPPPKMMPPPPNTIDITGTTAELMAQNGGAGEMRGVNGEQLMNMGGEASATVKIEEIEDDEQLTWVNSVIPLETPEERENRLAAEQAAQMEAAATMASMFAAVVPQPPVDTVDDCINSVIRNALEPPQVPQSDLLKPKLTYETLCYEAFEFIEQNFKQSSLKMSDICHYISHKYRYFASGIMWRKQIISF